MNRRDVDGHEDDDPTRASTLNFMTVVGLVAGALLMIRGAMKSTIALGILVGGMTFLAGWFGFLRDTTAHSPYMHRVIAGVFTTTLGCIIGMGVGAHYTSASIQSQIKGAVETYAGVLLLFMAAESLAESGWTQ